MKTYTPELDVAVLQRLRDYAALFAEDFPQAKPARWTGVYLQGLLLDGERKSIEPLARRIAVPEDLLQVGSIGRTVKSLIQLQRRRHQCAEDACAQQLGSVRRSLGRLLSGGVESRA